MGKLKIVLFIIGMMLCVFPMTNQGIARCRGKATVIEYQKDQLDREVIGILEIPKINLILPIYRGVDDETLEKGIGHLEWSSLPGGGISTHCLLAGHRGLPGAELFTRLNEIKKGDFFYVQVKKEKIAYQVCAVHVIKPEETEGLGIQANRDLVSLITCTPYGINTHRLIVTGERTEEEK